MGIPPWRGPPRPSSYPGAQSGLSARAGGCGPVGKGSCEDSFSAAGPPGPPRPPLPPCVSFIGEQIYLEKMLYSVQILYTPRLSGLGRQGL